MSEQGKPVVNAGNDQRIAYEPPVLTVLGTVEDITKGDQNSGNDDSVGAGLKTGDGG